MILQPKQMESLREMLADLRTYYFAEFETASQKNRAYIQSMLFQMAQIEFELNLAREQ